jgi:hypothetical protein
MATHRLDPHGSVFEVDPEKIDTVSDGFGHLRIGDVDADPAQCFVSSESLPKSFDAFEEHEDLPSE